ncbi:MAG TPA: ABC transporter ATP-binding protein [Methanocellaceae archaeon]
MPISLTGVSHFYRKGEPDETWAFRDVSLSIVEREFTVIAGRNGSGKSTLLHCMSGLMKPSKGTVAIDGKGAAASRGLIALAVQFPERALFGNTLYDDVAFGLHNRGMDEKQIKGRVYRAVEIVGLDKELLNISPRELSNGQKRLAALAGIIVTEPKYLFLDEPTAGLDAPGRMRVLKVLAHLNQEGTTVVIASHDLTNIMGVCRRVVILDRGGIVADCQPQELISLKCLESMGLALPYQLIVARELWRRGVQVEDMSPEKLAEGICR